MTVANYNLTSSPAIGNFVWHAFKSGNILYVSTERVIFSELKRGLFVINTQGTETQVDDVVEANYFQGMEPFGYTGGDKIFSSQLTRNLLYISSMESGVTVFNTQGTTISDDDVIVAEYTISSSPAIDDNFTEFTFVSGNLLYITSVSGVSVVNTQGTLSQGDDVLVADYTTTSSPAIGNTPWYSMLSGNYLHIATDGGLFVINTQGTNTQADDTLVATYNSASTPSIGDGSASHVFLDGNLLYISTFGSTTGNGLVVINTQGTETQTDDTITRSFSVATTPAIALNDIDQSFLSGDLLYMSTYGGGVSVIQLATGTSVSDALITTLPINATISITSPTDVTLGNIAGSGQSDLATNSVEWITKTNNSAGYELSIQASNASMENANLDTIGAYTPATPSTPEPWSVASADSECGMHYSWPQSTRGDDIVWGADDTYADNWMNVPTTPYVIETATSPTDNIGDSAVILFGAEIGSSKIQPSGAYAVDVTMTATTL